MGTYIGTGIYGIAEASRLTGVSDHRIRYWLRGYAYKLENGHRKKFPPKWKRQLPDVGHRVALGFLDLMEVRFVDFFRREGVKWKVINKAASKARKHFNKTHPFSTLRFKTDGYDIFAESSNEEGDLHLYDIAEDQQCFERILQQYLLQGVEFDEKGNAYRWYPAGFRGAIVLDPNRSFGQPIVADDGIPTAVLAQAYGGCLSYDEVAWTYEVSKGSVKAAVKFERKLVAA